MLYMCAVISRIFEDICAIDLELPTKLNKSDSITSECFIKQLLLQNRYTNSVKYM